MLYAELEFGVQVVSMDGDAWVQSWVDHLPGHFIACFILTDFTTFDFWKLIAIMADFALYGPAQKGAV